MKGLVSTIYVRPQSGSAHQRSCPVSDGKGPRCHLCTDRTLIPAMAADVCCVFPSIRLCLSKTTCWSVTTPAPPIQYRMITFIDRQN